MTLQADAAQRQAIYRSLEARNRIVGILRIGVPALGLITLVVLIGQIYLSSLTGRFGIASISVTPDAVSVQSPEYAGVLDDGTTYRVWANSAKATVNASDRIDLSVAALTMNRANGVVMNVNAPLAVLDTTGEVVAIKGIAYVEDSTGTSGVIENSVFDYARQNLVAEGPVHIDYADGTALDSVGMTYDTLNAVWTFSRVSVTLPGTPGAATSETPMP